MSFDTLLGNDTIKARLSSALSNRRLSHCFLITGPVGSGKHTLARLLSAAMQCTQETKPCLQCSQCRKVLDGMHPDIIHVTDSDRKAVSVKIVREACADLYIRPNEGNRKIYLFDQELNPQGQNALLKSIEEPPPYGSFLLLTQHAEQMLPTIRSRCVELRLSAAGEFASNGAFQTLSEYGRRSNCLRDPSLRRIPRSGRHAFGGIGGASAPIPNAYAGPVRRNGNRPAPAARFHGESQARPASPCFAGVVPSAFFCRRLSARYASHLSGGQKNRKFPVLRSPAVHAGQPPSCHGAAGSQCRRKAHLRNAHRYTESTLRSYYGTNT